MLARQDIAVREGQAGLLLVIWAVVNSSALLDFGLGRALTLHLARSGADEASSNLVSVAFWLAVLIGVAFGIALYLSSGAVATLLGAADLSLNFHPAKVSRRLDEV